MWLLWDKIDFCRYGSALVLCLEGVQRLCDGSKLDGNSVTNMGISNKLVLSSLAYHS